MFFKKKESLKELEELKEDIEWTINAFAFLIFEKKELIHVLLREIINKENFTEEDIERYKKYLIDNRLTFEEFEEDIERVAKEKKYCKCEVEDGKIKCSIDERLRDVINIKSEKDFYSSILALMEILYTYKEILLKIQNGEVKELKEELLKDSNILSVL